MYLLGWMGVWLWCGLAWNQVLVSEVFANAYGTSGDEGKEWVEIYNAGEQPVSLLNLVIRRLDDNIQTQAFRVVVDADVVLKPGQYAVLAQSQDLGLGMCLRGMVVVLPKGFSLKNQGIQWICVQPNSGVEDCALFSDKKPFPDGHSRFVRTWDPLQNDSLLGWETEYCKMSQELYATPGLEQKACERDKDAFQTQLVPCESTDAEEEPRGEQPPIFPTVIGMESKWESDRHGQILYGLGKEGLECINMSLWARESEGTSGILLKEGFGWWGALNADFEIPCFAALPSLICMKVQTCFAETEQETCIKTNTKQDLGGRASLLAAKYSSKERAVVVRVWNPPSTRGNWSFLIEYQGILKPLLAGVRAVAGEQEVLVDLASGLDPGVKLIGLFHGVSGEQKAEIQLDGF